LGRIINNEDRFVIANSCTVPSLQEQLPLASMRWDNAAEISLDKNVSEGM
jgi:hypothetical protein